MVTQRELQFSFQGSVCTLTSSFCSTQNLENSFEYFKNYFQLFKKSWKIRHLRLRLFLSLITPRGSTFSYNWGPCWCLSWVLTLLVLCTPQHSIVPGLAALFHLQSHDCKPKNSPLSLTAEHISKYFALEDQPQIQLWSPKITMQ